MTTRACSSPCLPRPAWANRASRPSSTTRSANGRPCSSDRPPPTASASRSRRSSSCSRRRPGGLVETPSRSRRRSASGWPTSPTVRPSATASPRSSGSVRRSRPTPPGRCGACSRSSPPSSRSSWCSRTSTGRSRRCSTWPMPSSSAFTVPCSSCASRGPSSSNSARPGRPGSHARSRRLFLRSRRRMPGASRSFCSGRRHPHRSSTGSARRPRGTLCTWSSSRRCSPIRGSSSTAGGWVPTTPRSRSPRRCRRSSPRGSIDSIPRRA